MKLPILFKKTALFIFLSIFVSFFCIPLLSAEPQSSEALKLDVQQVELGRTVTLAATGLRRYLVTHTDIVEFAGQNDEGLTLKGLHLGSTVVLLWDAGGLRSVRMDVVQPKEDVARLQELLRTSSPVEQERRKRSFKITLEDYGSVHYLGKSISSADQTDKVNDQKIHIEGGTPYGEIQSSVFTESIKDRALDRVVWTPRDAWVLLTHNPWPLLNQFNIQAGENYFSTNDFSLPFTRFNGITLTPARPSTEKPKPLTLEPTLLIGQKRDGGFYDNPADIMNRQIKDDVAAENLDFYLREDTKLFAGTAQRWNGISNGQASYDNYMGYSLTPGPWKWEGEVGQDDTARTAMKFLNGYETDWLTVHNKWRDIAKDYRTTNGPVTAAGEIGSDTSVRVFPLIPLTGYKRLSVDLDADIYRSREFLNPEDAEGLNQDLYAGALWMLPEDINLRSSYNYRDFQAQSFPYVQNTADMRLSRGFEIHQLIVRRIEFSALTKYDDYTKSVGTPGFNSTRYELGGGIDAVLYGGFWASVNYSVNRLEEKEVSILPAVTHPSEVNYSVGFSRPLWNWPVTLNTALRYTGDAETFGKIHQPYSNEKRLACDFGLDWHLRNGTTTYVQVSTDKIESLIGDPKTAEVSIDFGAKVPWDTGFSFPASGYVQGFFFKDQNANGVLDPGELRMENMEIQTDGGVKAVTNKNGFYRMTVTEGTMIVRSVSKVPTGYYFTTANQKKITILAGKTVEMNFGIAPQVDLKGRVYFDVNENGVYDAGDIAMSGVRIVLMNGQSAVASELGFYTILKIPIGAQRARVDLDSIPFGYKTMTPVEKTFNAKPGMELTYDVIFQAQRSVSGVVFEDSNGDGTAAPDKKTIAGIRVTFQGATLTTSDKGKFIFRNVKPGPKQPLTIDATSLPQGWKAEKSEMIIDVPVDPYVKNDANFALKGPETTPKK